jgi:diguanylate cyclase (GGDEF)-like protein/PAS domain S-box-containing protein
VTAVIAARRDMTKYHLASGKDTRLVNQLSAQVLRQVLDSSTEGVLLLSASEADLHVVYANAQFERLSGYPRERLDGMALQALVGTDAESGAVRDALAEGRCYSGALRLAREDGSRWRASFRSHPVYEEDGRVAYWLCHFLPPAVTAGGEPADSWGAWFEQDGGRGRERFGRLDRADASSGLLRFERFRDFLERDLGIARRERRPVSVMFLQILELDRYRATFGKNAADSCLRMIGKQVSASLRRATDLCARFDGDAIIAAVFGHDAAEASRLLERIAENIDGLRIHNPRGLKHRFLSVRSAVVESNGDEERFEDLLERLQMAVAEDEDSAASA